MARQINPTMAAYATECAELHRHFAIWQQTCGRSLYGLLAAYDSMLLPKLRGTAPAHALGSIQQWKSLDEGLAQAIRWHLALCGLSPVEPSAQGNVIEDAADLLFHARDYFTVEYFHRRHGLGFVDVEIDAASKRVRFVPIWADSTRRAALAYGDRAVLVNQLRAERDRDVGGAWSELVRAALLRGRYPLRDGRICFDTFGRDMKDALIDLTARRPAKADEWLAPSDDLIGFNVGELDLFWNAVVVWSMTATTAYLSLYDQGTPQKECMPTQVIQRALFLTNIAAMTGLSEEKVDKILRRLSLDATTTRPDIILQPFLASSEQVAWSVFLAQIVAHRRNMLKLMARTHGLAQVAALLIGRRERPTLRAMGERLQRLAGWRYQILTPAHEPEDFEIDLLGYAPKYPDELLLVECKGVLEADELQEIRSATDQMLEGQKQLRRSTKLLMSLPLDKRKQLFRFVDWQSIQSVYCLVVTPDTEPSGDLTHDEIPAIAFDTMLRRLRSSQWRNPSRLWTACKERDWLRDIAAPDVHYDPIKLGSVTYELPMYSLAP